VPDPVPQVASAVHYVPERPPPRPWPVRQPASRCQAAVITEVRDEYAGLFVMTPAGSFHQPLSAGGSHFEDGGCDGVPLPAGGRLDHTAGSWHYPGPPAAGGS
jgi:hypothetical protein